MLSLRKILLEVTKFAAKSKDSGKLVYFKTKQAKDTAIKKGTHQDPKETPKEKSKVVPIKGNSIFPKEKTNTSKVEINKRTDKNIDTFFVKELDVWNKQKHPLLKNIEAKTEKTQQNWLNKFNKNNKKELQSAISSWQSDWNRSGLNNVDNIITKNPPPPIETSEKIFRGKIIYKKDLEKLIKTFNTKQEIKLPIRSFSTDLKIVYNLFNMLNDLDENLPQCAVVMSVKSECNKLNGIYLPAMLPMKNSFSDEKEVLMPSNQIFKVNKIHNIEFTKSKNYNSLIVIDLIQKCNKNEDIENHILDLTNDEFIQNLLQTPMRTKK
jgi:hypothetical protein